MQIKCSKSFYVYIVKLKCHLICMQTAACLLCSTNGQNNVQFLYSLKIKIIFNKKYINNYWFSIYALIKLNK